MSDGVEKDGVDYPDLRDPMSLLCGNCGSELHLYRDSHGTFCRQCGPRYPVVRLYEYRQAVSPLPASKG